MIEDYSKNQLVTPNKDNVEIRPEGSVSHTVAGFEVILDIGVEVATQTTGSPHKLWAEFDVDRPTVSVPGQGEALLSGHQDIVGDLLQLQVMDVVRQFKTRCNKTCVKTYTLVKTAEQLFVFLKVPNWCHVGSLA